MESDIYQVADQPLLWSEYRNARWMALPKGHLSPQWVAVNPYRRKRFPHHVTARGSLAETMAWCEEQFGPQAIGHSGTELARYWTRGVWTALKGSEEGETTLMFLERGMAALAKVRWG